MTIVVIGALRVKILIGMVDTVDPDQKEQSDLGLYYLHMPFYQEIW